VGKGFLVHTRIAAPAVLIAALVAAAGPVISAQPATGVRADDKTVVHVLNRLGFGPSPRDIERIHDIGVDKYMDEQLRPESLSDRGMAARLSGFDTLAMSSRELAARYFVPAQLERRRAQRRNATQTPADEPAGSPAARRDMRSPGELEVMQTQRRVFTQLAQQKILRAIYSERQLNEVMVDFWFNHFNVFAGKGQTRNYLTEYERDVIRPHVFGTFRDLLGATAKSPAMLFYLDNWRSAAPEGAPTVEQRRPRGLNENYARELMELHTLGVDGGYTQKDVQEVARAFTGWTIANPRLGGGFRFDRRMHDDGEKTVLGHRIKGGGGQRDAETVLDILAAHPSTARFVATKLVRRFVADAPPPALVERAAARFRETHGDIREVVRTIVTSPEFFADDAYRAKVRTPFEFVAAALRATSAEAAYAMPLVQALRDLGMPPYQCQPPTGYADRADAWVNAGALLNRMNFALSLTSGTLRGIQVPVAASVEAARDAMVNIILAGDLAASTRATVAKATTRPQVTALLLGSPEFQRK
jgi:uncharacterized protein (DUF1800 family)